MSSQLPSPKDSTLYASATCGHCKTSIAAAKLYPEYVRIVYPESSKEAYDEFSANLVRQTPTLMASDGTLKNGPAAILGYLYNTYGRRE